MQDKKRAPTSSAPPEKATAPAQVNLDATLLEFLMASEPPPFALGSLPPPAIMESIPPMLRWRMHSEPPRDSLVERVVTDITALPDRVPVRAPPPVPAPTPVMRTRKLVSELEAVGPGDEAPIVQRLLAIGDTCLDQIADAFPGLLWFDRRLPHTRIARGRDVSPLGRVLVAFGERAEGVILRLIANEDREKRFYATLVAAEICTEPLIVALGERTLDRDEGIRTAAAASLAPLAPAATRELRARLRQVVEGADRDARVNALAALALFRDEETLPLAIELFDPLDVGQTDVAVRILVQLTARELPNEAAWRAWAAKHAQEPRSQWLIDALDEEDSRLAVYAVRELERLLGVEIAFDEGGGKKERQRVKKVVQQLVAP